MLLGSSCGGWVWPCEAGPAPSKVPKAIKMGSSVLFGSFEQSIPADLATPLEEISQEELPTDTSTKELLISLHSLPILDPVSAPVAATEEAAHGRTEGNQLEGGLELKQIDPIEKKVMNFSQSMSSFNNYTGSAAYWSLDYNRYDNRSRYRRRWDQTHTDQTHTPWGGYATPAYGSYVYIRGEIPRAANSLGYLFSSLNACQERRFPYNWAYRSTTGDYESYTPAIKQIYLQR